MYLLKSILRKKQNWRIYLRRVRSAVRNIKYGIKNLDYSNDIQKPKRISKDLKIGKYCSINHGAWICPNVVIGNYVLIAPEFAILGGDHNYDEPGKAIIFSGRPEKIPKTIICDDVWIGYRVIIISGAKIGRGSIIAAGSLIIKDVEPYSIVSGVPAKKIGERFNKEQRFAHDKYLNKKPEQGKYVLPKKFDNY